MPEDSEFNAMAEACIAAGEHVMQAGSPALKAAMRMALAVLGRDVARNAGIDPPRQGSRTNGADGTG